MSKFVLFTYSSRNLNKTDKVKFYYALKGRDSNKGLVERTNTKFLAKGVLLTSIIYKKEIEDFLNFWKLQYKEMIVKEVEDEAS